MAKSENYTTSDSWIILHSSGVCYTDSDRPTRSSFFSILPLFTYEGVEPVTEAGQKGKSDEVPEAGSHGCGHVVRVDSHPLGPNDHTHHNNTWRGLKTR